MEEYFSFERKDMGHGPYGGLLSFLTGRIWVTVRMEEYFRFDRKDMGHGPYGGILSF